MTLECNCTRCEGTGFLNTHQLPDQIDGYNTEEVLKWIENENEPHDVEVCDCCGNGESWSHEPGIHNIVDQPIFDCM